MIKAQLSTLITLLISLSTIIIIITSSSAAKFSIAKDHCTDRCGDVEIPYPFGIGEGCYLNETFQIDCFTNYSKNPVVAGPVPFWSNVSSNVQVSNISLEEGNIELMSFITRTCYNESGIDYESSVNASLTIPFAGFTLNASSNKFYVIGCDDIGIYSGKDYTGGKISRNGCITYCHNISDINNGTCNGIGCCDEQIPQGQSVLEMTLSTFGNNHSQVLEDNPCSYAFLIATKHFSFSNSNLTDLRTVEALPAVIVDWVVGNSSCEEAKQNLTSYACKGSDTHCVDNPDDDIGRYRCACPPGFEGNPYLADCTDINECADGKPNPCSQDSVCNNEPAGNYTCKCKKGYEGDGKKEEGCKRRADTSVYDEIISGTSVGVVVILVVGCLLYSRNRRRKLQKERDRFFRDNGGVLLQNRLRSNENGHSTKIFSIDELKKASNNFDISRIVGEGGFGTVYKGYLPNNSVIAIKKSKAMNRNQIDSFINEVFVLSQINHRNIVKLLGCCFETEIPLLVYEFVDNGNLYEHIHDAKKSSLLTFQMRLKIAAESAGVLSYMHSVASPPIIHRDIKSANILLDKSYTAKVADFGTSRTHLNDHTQISTIVKGTLGYLDPEYLQTSQLTEKSDVYSFGVLLIELFTGRKALSHDEPEEERTLTKYFLTKLKNDTLFDILDHSISNEGTKELLHEIAILAKQCVNVSGEQRPSMKEVAMELEGMMLTKCMDLKLGKDVEEMEPFLIEGPSDS